MKERIQKIISARGVASRRKAEEMILSGRVACNGIPCTLGDTADPELDTITVDGAPIPMEGERVYIMLNKPRGFVTTLSDEKGRKNAAQLVADCGKRVYPVGRLDKFLCDSGVGTRSQVKIILKSGRVTVDGRVEKDNARKIDPDKQVICLDGESLGGKHRVVLMLNKPAGYVTATEDKNDKTVMELLPQEYRHLDLKPVGRLDKATEGLLLFTNDGGFANGLMHPKHEVNKTYSVTVLDYSPEGFEKLKQPITIDGYTVHAPEVSLKTQHGGKAELLVTIHEGRNRQVRRMCAAAGMRVIRLVRIREGGLSLGDLPKGRWRYLTDEEIQSLKE